LVYRWLPQREYDSIEMDGRNQSQSKMTSGSRQELRCTSKGE